MSGQHVLEHFPQSQPSVEQPEFSFITPHMHRGLEELLTAYEYASYTEQSPWDFAVEIKSLKELDLNECDLRWLTCQNYVEHAREITRPEENGREFRSTGLLNFDERTCFVLTANGAVFARRVVEESPSACCLDCIRQSQQFSRQTTELVPTWDSERRELRLAGQIVKQFKWPAINQERILAAFQEEDWTARVDDPLPPEFNLDPRRRLHDTIKCLNRNQRRKLINFRGDGTGEGVIWELVQ